jgi:hypothetical protein
MDPVVPNDDLGEWGEARFRALCAAGSLVANKVDRDKMGWDFWIELPPQRGLPLDQRPNGLRCRIQIKTQWQTNDGRFKITLPSVERLVKDPGPSFILLLIAQTGDNGNDPSLVGCHLVHMLGANLERVLRRLRKAETETEATPFSDQTITYDSTVAGEHLAATGIVLRDALLRICGTDAHVYIDEKKRQLKELGYTTGRYRLDTTFTACNMDEFVEMMLGLRPASLSAIKTYDNRFNMPVPIQPVPLGDTYSFRIIPHPVAECIIRVRSSNKGPAVVLRGEVYLPVHPGIPEEHWRMLVKAGFLNLDLRGSGEVNLKLDLPGLIGAEMDLEGWQKNLLLLIILGNEEVYFDISAVDTSKAGLNTTLKSTTPLPQEHWVAPMSELVRIGVALLSHAGGEGQPTTLEKLAASAEDIMRAYANMLEPASMSPHAFETSDDLFTEAAYPSADTGFLYADYVLVAGAAIAYSLSATMRPEQVENGRQWRQIDRKPERLEIIAGTREAFDAFVSRATAQVTPDKAMVRAFRDASEQLEDRARPTCLDDPASEPAC